MSFITSRKVSEAVLVSAGIVAADGSAGVTTEYADMGNSRMLMVFAQVSAGEVTTIQLREATDAEGTDAQDLGDPVAVDAASGFAEVAAADLSDGFTHVAAVVTASGANPTSATLIGGEPRFNP